MTTEQQLSTLATELLTLVLANGWVDYLVPDERIDEFSIFCAQHDNFAFTTLNSGLKAYIIVYRDGEQFVMSSLAVSENPDEPLPPEAIGLPMFKVATLALNSIALEHLRKAAEL